MSSSVFEASDEVVNEAAAACARRLAKWFGGVDEAIAALEADPADLADLALRDYMQWLRQMRLKVHMNPDAFSRVLLQMIA